MRHVVRVARTLEKQAWIEEASVFLVDEHYGVSEDKPVRFVPFAYRNAGDEAGTKRKEEKQMRLLRDRIWLTVILGTRESVEPYEVVTNSLAVADSLAYDTMVHKVYS